VDSSVGFLNSFTRGLLKCTVNKATSCLLRKVMLTDTEKHEKVVTPCDDGMAKQT
jgi:hypothetical protein